MPGKTEIIHLGHSDCDPSFNLEERKIGQPYSETFGDVHFVTKKISKNVVRMTHIIIEHTVVDSPSDSCEVNLQVKLKDHTDDWDEPKLVPLSWHGRDVPAHIISYTEPLPEGVRFEAESEHPYVLATIKRITKNQKITTLTTYQDVSNIPLSQPIDRPQSESHQPLAACPVSVS